MVFVSLWKGSGPLLRGSGPRGRDTDDWSFYPIRSFSGWVGPGVSSPEDEADGSSLVGRVGLEVDGTQVPHGPYTGLVLTTTPSVSRGVGIPQGRECHTTFVYFSCLLSRGTSLYSKGAGVEKEEIGVSVCVDPGPLGSLLFTESTVKYVGSD